MKKLSSKNLEKNSDSNEDFSNVPIPSDEYIASLCSMVSSSIKQVKRQEQYATVKEILITVGLFGVIALTFVMPPAAIVGKTIFDEKKKKSWKEWKQYNTYYLKRSLKRLQDQKIVEIVHRDNQEAVILTKDGRKRIIKYALDELSVQKPTAWDGKWRLVIYDVEERKRKLRDIFRQTLHGIGFYKLQESVWLYPYPCEKQVAFLREYYGVGNDVLYIVASTLEDDRPYREYFGIT